MFMSIINTIITGMSYAVIILGVLTLFSLLITWIYLLEKRLAANVFGQGVFFQFLVEKVIEKHKEDERHKR